MNPLEDLIYLLISLYPTVDDARGVAEAAGLPTRKIKFDGSSENVWRGIIRLSEPLKMTSEIVRVAQRDFPNVSFSALTNIHDKALVKAPNIKDLSWRELSGNGTELEKVIGEQPTFLPISFFEMGISKSKSVVRIVTPSGLGSGFITKNNLLITNHHVIPNELVAGETKIQFNYQLTIEGLSANPIEFNLSPAEGFATSPQNGGDDWTAIRVKGNPSMEWGELPLINVQVKPNDYVNIIQHPGGLPKQVAIYHNVVTFADTRRVQYLTDTYPGSSGSPVFNSNWDVVALHHSGGWIAEPGTKQVLFRNEGISITSVIEGIKKSGLL